MTTCLFTSQHGRRCYIAYHVAGFSSMLMVKTRSSTVTDVQTVVGQGLPYVFTDRHPRASYASYKNDIRSLGIIDWALMSARYWNCTPDDPDRRQRREAEFLIKDHFPVRAITMFVTRNQNTYSRVRELLNQAHLQTGVTITPGWYFS